MGHRSHTLAAFVSGVLGRIDVYGLTHGRTRVAAVGFESGIDLIENHQSICEA
jgi:hypothetical protein